MAALVWAEYKDNDSRACRGCHVFSIEVLAKQQETARAVHAPVLQGHATCIDCHKGVGHVAPRWFCERVVLRDAFPDARASPNLASATADIACPGCLRK